MSSRNVLCLHAVLSARIQVSYVGQSLCSPSCFSVLWWKNRRWSDLWSWHQILLGFTSPQGVPSPLFSVINSYPIPLLVCVWLMLVYWKQLCHCPSQSITAAESSNFCVLYGNRWAVWIGPSPWCFSIGTPAILRLLFWFPLSILLPY